MPFCISSASGRRVDLLNPVDIHPHDMMRSASLRRMSDSMSPPPAQDGSASPPSASVSPRVSTMPTPMPDHPILPGKRIYRCADCQKVFSTSGHLTRHSKVHTGEKNHICPYPDCQRRCSRRDNLLQHYTMHLTKEERDLPTTYVREALSAMQSRMGTYVHPYPRGTGPLPPSPAHTHTSMMHVDRSPTQPTHAISPVYSHSHSPAHQRYPEHSTYVRTEQPTSRPIPLTASPTSIKRPHDLDMEMPRPHSVRRTSSSSSDSTMEPATPPMPLQAPMRKEYVPRMPEERGFQVSSVRGTL